MGIKKRLKHLSLILALIITLFRAEGSMSVDKRYENQILANMAPKANENPSDSKAALA